MAFALSFLKNPPDSGASSSCLRDWGGDLLAIFAIIPDIIMDFADSSVLILAESRQG